MSDHSVLEPYWGLDYGYQFSHRHHFEYLGLRSISDRLAFVSDHFCSGPWAARPIADIMQQCHRETGRIPVLCLDSNPWPVQIMVDELEQQLDLAAWFVFNTDVRPEVSVHANLAPWPSWIVNQQLEHNYQIGRSRQHRVSFMSGTARYHRIRLWYEARDLIRPEDVWVINKFSAGCLYDDCASLSEAQWAESLLDQLPWSNNQAFLVIYQLVRDVLRPERPCGVLGLCEYYRRNIAIYQSIADNRKNLEGLPQRLHGDQLWHAHDRAVPARFWILDI